MKIKFSKVIFLILAFSAVTAFMPVSDSSKKPVYLNTAYSFEERAADLVSRLTPEEKQSLLGNSMAAVPRLGINAYNVWGRLSMVWWGCSIPMQGRQLLSRAAHHWVLHGIRI